MIGQIREAKLEPNYSAPRGSVVAGSYPILR